MAETTEGRGRVEEGRECKASEDAWASFKIQPGEILEFQVPGVGEQPLSPDDSWAALCVTEIVTNESGEDLVKGRCLGAADEGVRKELAIQINRKGLGVHLCRADPCDYVGDPGAVHVRRVRWWQAVSFRGDYLTSWGNMVLEDFVKGGVGEEDPPAPAPKTPPEPKRRRPAGEKKAPASRAKKPKVDEPLEERPEEGRGRKKTKPEVGRRPVRPGGAKGVAEQVAKLRARLRSVRDGMEAGMGAGTEVIEVESEEDGMLGPEDFDFAAPSSLPGLTTGDHLDPLRSQLAVHHQVVKQEDTKHGISNKKRVKKKIRKASKGGATHQLLAMAEQRERKDLEEKKKKSRKSEGSGGKVKADEDPSDGDGSSEESSEEESTESEALPPLQKKSRKKPGQILRMLTTHAQEELDQSALIDVEASRAITGGVKLATYLNLLIRPYHPTTSRDMKELHHLAICLDELRGGRLAALGDSLAARFLAIHSAVNEGGWRAAQYLELHPLEAPQSAPTSLLLEAKKHAKVVARAQGADYGGRGWHRQGGGWQKEDGGEKGKGKGKTGRGGKGKWNQRNWGDSQGWGGNPDKGNWWDKNQERKQKEDPKDGKKAEK